MIKKIIATSVMFGILLPSFCLAVQAPPPDQGPPAAQGPAAQMPETLEEAKSFGMRILGGLPGAVKDVWENQALPLWQKLWEWLKGFIEPWWQKFLGLLDKKTPDLEEEFQKEKKEMQKELPKVGKSLWKRFKDLLK